MTAPAIDTATSIAREAEIPWGEFADGIEVKLLRIAADGSSYTILSRFGPGTVLPRHRHFGPVHAYTLEGRWHYREYDWFAESGSFVYEPTGSTHTLEVPAGESGPAVVYFTVQGGMVLLDDDDQPWMWEDAQSMQHHYANALEGRGIPYPASVLA